MVTPKPRELERKMSEEKKKESQGGATGPKPELQTVRFEWPGLPVGPGSDIIFYKPDQRRQGELPPGVQPVPAIWLPSPQDGTWQYTVLTENNLANDQPATSPPQGLSGTKHIIACGGMIIIVLMVLSFLDRYRLLKRFRPKRAPVQNTLKIVCQIPDEYTAPSLPEKSDESNGDEPPSYSEQNPAADLAARQRLANLIPPYSCIFTSGKNKVPRVLFFDPRKDMEVMEKMGLTKMQGESSTTQKMNLNIPTHLDMHDSHTERANLLIQINDTETESGCVIGMDVIVKKDSEEALILRENEGIPIHVTVEQLGCIDPKEMKKSDAKAKK